MERCMIDEETLMDTGIYIDVVLDNHVRPSARKYPVRKVYQVFTPPVVVYIKM